MRFTKFICSFMYILCYIFKQERQKNTKTLLTGLIFEIVTTSQGIIKYLKMVPKLLHLLLLHRNVVH